MSDFPDSIFLKFNLHILKYSGGTQEIFTSY